MIKSALLLLCLCFAGSVVTLPRLDRPDQAHRQWLEERYKEAISIKEGMTFADLFKSFEPDGGLQLMLPERYVLRSCSMIKVDVQFDLPEGGGHKRTADVSEDAGSASDSEHVPKADRIRPRPDGGSGRSATRRQAGFRRKQYDLLEDDCGNRSQQ